MMGDESKRLDALTRGLEVIRRRLRDGSLTSVSAVLLCLDSLCEIAVTADLDGELVRLRDEARRALGERVE